MWYFSSSISATSPVVDVRAAPLVLPFLTVPKLSEWEYGRSLTPKVSVVMFLGDHPTLGAYYKDETITVDGRAWVNCIFERCVLIRNDTKTQLWQSQYLDCRLEGAGWPTYWPTIIPMPDLGPDAQAPSHGAT